MQLWTYSSQKKVPYFLEMSLSRQLQVFLRQPYAAELLFSKANRQKMVADALEDVYDGDLYKAMEEGEGPLSSPNNFTYNFNADGLKATKTSSVQVWPIYIRVNEVPMHARQKHMFLAGVWIGKGDPDMNLFLQGFVQQANRLSQNGINWHPRVGGPVVNSKFSPLCCTVDSKARCIMLNQIGPTGYYACNFCTISGVQANGVKFPIHPHPQQAVNPVLRTDAMMRRDMTTALNLRLQGEQDFSQQGMQGVSVLNNLRHFDLVRGFSTDDLHPIFEGVVRHHIGLLVDTKHEDQPWYIGTPIKKALLNSRLREVRLPTLLARSPRDMTSLCKWRGNELRNFILYSAVPLLEDIVVNQRHWNLIQCLSRATYLVMKASITEDDLVVAEMLFRRYVSEFELIFGVEHMRYNIHMLLHIVMVVRLLGPTFVHSTCHFESWNLKLRNHIQSMNGPLNQIVTRHLLLAFVRAVTEDPQISPGIRQILRDILEGIGRKNVTRVDDVLLLGDGKHRQPSPLEIRAIQRLGIKCDGLTEYLRTQFTAWS